MVSMHDRLSRLSKLRGYAYALASVALASLLRQLLAPLFGTNVPYLLQLLAILASAWFLGLGPAFAGMLFVIAPSFYAAAFHSPVMIWQAGFWVRMATSCSFVMFLSWALDRQRGMR